MFRTIRKLSTITEIKNTTQFYSLIKTPKTTVVDFYATWCPPCKAMDPIIKGWAEKVPEVQFLKADVDNSGDVALENGVTAMPTFLVFKEGLKVGQIVGANPQGLRDLIKEHSGVDVKERK